MKSKSAKLYSLSFISMLVISTFAFAFLLGSEVKMVSAETVPVTKEVLQAAKTFQDNSDIFSVRTSGEGVYYIYNKNTKEIKYISPYGISKPTTVSNQDFIAMSVSPTINSQTIASALSASATQPAAATVATAPNQLDQMDINYQARAADQQSGGAPVPVLTVPATVSPIGPEAKAAAAPAGVGQIAVEENGLKDPLKFSIDGKTNVQTTTISHNKVTGQYYGNVNGKSVEVSRDVLSKANLLNTDGSIKIDALTYKEGAVYYYQGYENSGQVTQYRTKTVTGSAMPSQGLQQNVNGVWKDVAAADIPPSLTMNADGTLKSDNLVLPKTLSVDATTGITYQKIGYDYFKVSKEGTISQISPGNLPAIGSLSDNAIPTKFDAQGNPTEWASTADSGLRTVQTFENGKWTAATDRGTMEVFGTTWSFGTGQVLQGLQWSLIVAGAVQTLGPVFGLDKDETNAITIAAMSGIMAGKLAYSLLGKGGAHMPFTDKGTLSTGVNGQGGWGSKILSSPYTSVAIGAATAWLVYNSMHKKEKESKEAVTFSCLPWQAPNGGSDCELCNDKTGLPCSEYRCKSLGQSCELQNIGTTREICVNANRRDASPPTIKPDYQALTSSFSYSDVKDMPPGAGFKIISNATNTGCIKPFTPLEFGIITDEPSQCRIDVEPKGSYDAMSAYFGGDSLYSYNHTESLSLPSTVDIKNSSLALANGKELSFFIRCKDATGNINEADYELKLCVDPSPDTTAPVIEGTSILNNGCISADSDNSTVDFYTNEPAECRWSFTANQDFGQMQNNMTCLNSIREINALQVYTCSSSLTGIARDGTNFYVKCKDQPALGNDTKRNPNREDYVFSLRGSNKLKLNTIQPNETVYGAVRPTAVELYAQTTYGCDSNQAYCYYSATGDEGSFVQFFDTNKGDGIHTQRLDLLEGDYTYYVRCVDSGGNLVENTTSFKVDIDTNAPIITRVYQKDDLLKVETQRSSECVFTNDNCDYLFVEGTEMPYANQPVHVTQWATDKTYYIKCRDEFRTEPTDCSMIVRPTANFL